MRGLAETTKDLIRYAHRLLEADHPQTLRQLHYAIFSRREIGYDNNQGSYERLSRATTMARRSYRDWELNGEIGPEPAGSIPPGWMVDETRQAETIRVEVWSEKATILGAIRPVAGEWGITLRVCHGFASAGMEQEIGSFFEELDKKITVFYLGDHDPSGHVIEEDIHRRVEASAGVSFEMRRLAIHPSDIREFGLPPQRIKATDTRSAGFRRRFDLDAATVELDALPAAELRRRVKQAVTSLIDFDRWNRQVMVRQAEFDSIAEFAESMKRLPQARPEATA